MLPNLLFFMWLPTHWFSAFRNIGLLYTFNLHELNGDNEYLLVAKFMDFLIFFSTDYYYYYYFDIYIYIFFFCFLLIFNHTPMEVSLIVVFISSQVTQKLVMDMESQVEVLTMVVRGLIFPLPVWFWTELEPFFPPKEIYFFYFVLW